MEVAKQEVTLANEDIIKFETDTSGNPGAYMVLTITHGQAVITSPISQLKFHEMQRKGQAVSNFADIR